MASYFNTLKKKLINETVNVEDNSKLIDDEQDDFNIEDMVDEMSTSAGAGGYETPNAFGELGDDAIEMLGYKKVKKKPIKKESTFKQMSSELFLNEIAYNEYKKDPIATPKHKINQSINFINRGLREIEKVVNHNVRLKQEMGVDNGMYWKSSRENLVKISERLLRVSKQLKELGS